MVDTRPHLAPVLLAPGVLLGTSATDAAEAASCLYTPTALPRKQWVHVAGTLDDATGVQSIYIDGLVVSTITTVRPFAELRKDMHPGIRIAGETAGSPSHGLFHGSIDEIRISDVGLDPSQFLPPPQAMSQDRSER
jgi:hypothetical protein